MVNINVKSHYSFRQSLLKPKDIVSFAKENHSKYACLCDVNYFGGALEFLSLCQSSDIQGIVGLEFKVKLNERLVNVLAYAKNTKGYHALMKVSSLLNVDRIYQIDYEVLEVYLDDLIILIDVLSSDLYKAYLLEEDYRLVLDEYKEAFNNFYYFMNDYHFDKTFILNFRESYIKEHEIMASSKHYLFKEDEATLQILKNIENYQKLELYALNKEGKDYLLEESEYLKHYSKEVYQYTESFLSLFEPIELKVEQTLPLYKESKHLNNAYLKKLAMTGLKKRLSSEDIPNHYLERLIYELETIIKMDYANYFLIVYDYVLFAKKSGIYVGPGRGSAAGSLLAYTLGITNIDPIKEGLIFERFLNPERISLPDIDVDFQTNRRDEIFTYLANKYGIEHVAHIVTYGSFQAKNSLSDVGKVLDLPEYKIKMLKEYVPDVLNIKLVDVLKENKALQKQLREDDLFAQVYHHAMKLQGIIRHPSIHAAGVLVSDKAMVEYTPTTFNQDSLATTQYDMDYLESIGLNKLDILGLETLDVLQAIVSDIGDDFKLESIPLNDEKTLALMSSGHTLGIFQYEEDFVRQTLRKMKVDSMADLVATTSLCRPGPMQFINEYIDRKHKVKAIDYILPELKDILEETYGIIVYQEQIMKITQVMANFSLAKADIVRKGMGKKDLALLEKIKDEFVQASIENGYSQDKAIEVYEMILKFSNYGFNKAHACSYALLGYQLGYLKAHYPLIFYRNILNRNVGKSEKLKKIIMEMNAFGLSVHLPDIRVSTNQFVLKDKTYYLPLSFIKGVSALNVKDIVEIRALNNEAFVDYVSSVKSLIKGNIKEGIIEKLIYAGALDYLEMTRLTMIENLDKVVTYLKIAGLDSDQMALALDVIPPPKIIQYQDNDSVNEKEFELLGMYFKSSPLSKYTGMYGDLLLSELSVNQKALCMVNSSREIKTKKGELMAFVNVSDQFDTRTLVVFPKVYRSLNFKFKSHDVLMIQGHQDEKEMYNIIVNKIKKLND